VQWFVANQELTREPSGVHSAVGTDAFRAFVAAVDGNAVDFIQGNHVKLSQLCEEFGLCNLELDDTYRHVDRRTVHSFQWTDLSKPISIQDGISR
jgi:hypothetical protein